MFRRDDHIWPSRSYDLTPLNFFLGTRERWGPCQCSTIDSKTFKMKVIKLSRTYCHKCAKWSWKISWKGYSVATVVVAAFGWYSSTMLMQWHTPSSLQWNKHLLFFFHQNETSFLKTHYYSGFFFRIPENYEIQDSAWTQ